MNNESKKNLYNKYKNSIYEAGGEMFIPLSLAESFIDDCRANNIAIIGIECFSIDKAGIKPLLDYIADYSKIKVLNVWGKKVEECYRLSVQFITNIKEIENVFLNFVLVSKDEK